jgi:hypothetical protein
MRLNDIWLLKTRAHELNDGILLEIIKRIEDRREPSHGDNILDKLEEKYQEIYRLQKKGVTRTLKETDEDLILRRKISFWMHQAEMDLLTRLIHGSAGRIDEGLLSALNNKILIDKDRLIQLFAEYKQSLAKAYWEGTYALRIFPELEKQVFGVDH